VYKVAIRFAVASVLLAVTTAAATDEDPAPSTEKSITGSFDVAIGVKILDDDWSPLGDQSVVVLALTIGKTTWPVQLALDYVKGESRDTNVSGFPIIPPFCCFTSTLVAESETTEWDVGVRHVWRQDKKFRPYAAGGVAFIDGELRVPAQGIFADSSTTGYWLDTGFRLRTRGRWDWGIDLRFSKGEVTLGNAEVDAGGPQALFYGGVNW